MGPPQRLTSLGPSEGRFPAAPSSSASHGGHVTPQPTRKFLRSPAVALPAALPALCPRSRAAGWELEATGHISDPRDGSSSARLFSCDRHAFSTCCCREEVLFPPELGVGDTPHLVVLWAGLRATLGGAAWAPSGSLSHTEALSLLVAGYSQGPKNRRQ